MNTDYISPEQAGQITTDPELESRIPPPAQDELRLLEESLKRNGCRDAIILWNDTVLDGHTRLRICKQHNIPFRCTSIELGSREEALRWVDMNQLARRNLTDEQRILVAGRAYISIKPRRGGTGANQNKKSKAEPTTSAKALGKRLGMSVSSVKRAADFARAVDADPELAARVARGEKVATIKPTAVVDTQKTDPAEVGGVGDIYKAFTALDRVWSATTQNIRDKFLADYSPSPAISDLLRALALRDADKSQMAQVDLSAETASAPVEAPATPDTPTVPPVAHHQEEPAADEPPLVAVARLIIAEHSNLGIVGVTSGTVLRISEDIVRRIKLLHAFHYTALEADLRTGNDRAKELADLVALHMGPRPPFKKPASLTKKTVESE